MTLDEYQKAACEFAVYPPAVGRAYTALGLAGEAGEVAEKVKKWIRDGKTAAEVTLEVEAELGDVFWYVALVAKEWNIPLSDVADLNLEKLADRKARGVLRGSGDHR